MLVALFVVSYLIGSIPFGVLMARSKGVDILKMGSGNPGATNVMRVLGKNAGYTVFLLDVLKGVIPTLMARWLIKEPVANLDTQLIWLLVGFSAVLGHCLSPFLGFKGGKGIATSLGAGVAAAPLVALSAFAVFFLFEFLTHYVSLASMIAIASTILWMYVYPGQSHQLLWPFLILTVLIVIRHRPNISRLLKGTESKTYLWGKGGQATGERVTGEQGSRGQGGEGAREQDTENLSASSLQDPPEVP